MKPDKRSPVDLDAAIDRAVRSIMSAEPRAGMRQRVLSRINEAPRRALPMLRLAIAGGGVALIALILTTRVGQGPVPPEQPAPVVINPPSTAIPTPSRPQTNVARMPPPISAAPPTRPTAPPSQRIPRGLVVAQSLPALDVDDPVQTGVPPQGQVMPELQGLHIPALRAIPELDTPVDSMPAIRLSPIEIPNLQPIAPLQGPSR
jgi:hypothetical protein